MPEWLDSLLADRARRTQPSAIREICRLLEQPEILSLAGGWPEEAVFPQEDVARLGAEVLKRYSCALQYAPTEGVTPLRQLLAARAVSIYGIQSADIDHTLVLSGSQQGMDLVSRVFIEPGDVVLCESPTYFGATGAIKAMGGEVRGVAMDDEGLRLDELEVAAARVLSDGKRLKGIYTIPNFQNPSGVTLSHARRMGLLDLAERYNCLIFEDDPYGDLRYEGTALPPLAALDKTERVIHMHSLSKVFCPGLRLAWLHAAPDIVRKLCISKQFVDTCTGAFSQYLALAYIEEGRLDARVAANIAFYRQKRDFMLSLLDRLMPPEVQFTRPQGGFFTFVSLPRGASASELLREAMAQHVVFVLGAPFYPDVADPRTFRLSFSQAPIRDIEAAITTLARLIRARIPREAAS